jgi:NDP-sugar pyrophosphorylase family protein
LTLPLAVLAGGLGTRLGERCRHAPKALVEVAGEPFLFRQLRLFKRRGLERVVICVGHFGEMIAEKTGRGERFGLSIDYSFDGPALLGTGGALARALPQLGGPFMVVYGDSWLDFDYLAAADFFRRSGQPALMTVFRNDNLYDRSNVLFEDGALKLYDKRRPLPEMRHVDYGLGCLAPEVFEGRRGAFDLADVYEELSRAGRLAGHLVEERFYEIGSAQGLAELEALLAGQGPAAAKEADA